MKTPKNHPCIILPTFSLMMGVIWCVFALQLFWQTTVELIAIGVGMMAMGGWLIFHRHAIAYPRFACMFGDETKCGCPNEPHNKSRSQDA